MPVAQGNSSSKHQGDAVLRLLSHCECPAGCWAPSSAPDPEPPSDHHPGRGGSQTCKQEVAFASAWDILMGYRRRGEQRVKSETPRTWN